MHNHKTNLPTEDDLVENIYLTIDQLVERWGGGVKRGTLAVWRSTGKGPGYIKAGKVVLYPIGEIKAYEQAHFVDTDIEDWGD